MIVVVLSEKRVLTGWPSWTVAEKWLNGWLAESRDRWGWVDTVEVVFPRRTASRGVAPPKRKKRKAKARAK